MGIIGLNQWDTSQSLSPFKQRKTDMVGGALSKVLGGIVEGASKRQQDTQLRKAAADLMGVPEDTIPMGIIDKEKYWELLKTKLTQEEDVGKSLLSMVAGVKDPEDVFGEKGVQEKAPYGMGAVGGEIMIPKDYSMEGGQILNPQGSQVGEYAPGYEPQKVSNEASSALIVDELMKALGTTQQESLRDLVGLPKERATKETKKSETQSFRDEINAAKTGEISFDELINKYPEENIRAEIQYHKVNSLPVNDKTKSILLQAYNTPLKDGGTVAFLEELKKQKREAKKNGVDVDYIFAHFGYTP